LYIHVCISTSVVDIEVACYGYEGVDAVKKALKCGLNMSTEDMPIKVFNLWFILFFSITAGIVQCNKSSWV